MSEAEWFGLPTGSKVESAPDRPAGRFGILRSANDELVATLRRYVRQIPEEEIELHEGGQYWTDTVTGEELELVRSFVDPLAPSDANGVAFAVRDGYVVPFKRRDDEGQVTRASRRGGRGQGHRAGAGGMTRAWWKDWPRRHWSELDWQRWERDGRPKVPADPVLEEQGKPLNLELPTAPPAHSLPAGFDHHPRRSTRRDARGRAVDQLLADLDIGKRRR